MSSHGVVYLKLIQYCMSAIIEKNILKNWRVTNEKVSRQLSMKGKNMVVTF